ncbi:hypothetical protein HYT17_01935 [Candidatus Microgenomates bacterium]|nr:hypothetical protein [Candidatus Microgenomates bacterium]
MKQLPPEATTEEGERMSTGALILGRLIFDTATPEPQRPVAVIAQRPQDKIPRFEPGQLADLRKYDIERLKAIFASLSNTPDSASFRNGPSHVIDAIMFFYAVANHRVASFDPTEDSYPQFVVKGAVGFTIAFLKQISGQMEFESNLFGTFEKARGEFNRNPGRFWMRNS